MQKLYLILLMSMMMLTLDVEAGIVIKTFTLLSNDLDARVNYPVIDQNGKKCALIKIQTTATGFSFDNGQLGIAATEYKMGEIWLYLPEGTRKLRMTHSTFGSLEGADIEEDGFYYFAQGLKAATTYRMVVEASSESFNSGNMKLGTVFFTCNVDSAEVLIGESEANIGVITFGKLSTSLPIGQKVDFKLRRAGFEDYTGQFIVEETTNVNIEMDTHQSTLSIFTRITAEVYVDGQRAGVGPQVLMLSAGTHNVRVTQDGFQDEEQNVVLAAKESKEIAILPDKQLMAQGVDLGLSVFWASCNVGAASPADCGKYYAWGELKTKESYTENNYKHINNNVYETIEDVDGLISGGIYDVAHEVQRRTWRLPTAEEVEELINECEWTWTSSVNSAGVLVEGYKITARNGNSIFLPAAGQMSGPDKAKVGSAGCYWTGQRDSGYKEYAQFLDIDAQHHYINSNYVYNGFTIRAVTE